MTDTQQLAPKYPHTLFARASVADVPFSVAKFSVQVLPDVHVFVDGRCVDRLIGFEDLGPGGGSAVNDTFTVGALEWRLSQTGALVKGQMTLKGALRDKGLHVDGDGERSDGEEERRGARGGERGRRKGRVGIRNGLFNDRDEDEWD